MESNLAFVQVTTGLDHSCAVSTAGEIWCWGKGTNVGAGNPGVLPGAFPCQGSSPAFQTYCVPRPVKTATSVTFKQLDAGENFTCAVATTGKIYCWGSDFYGVAKDGSGRLAPTQINEPAN